MSTIPAKSRVAEDRLPLEQEKGTARGAIAWTSFFFALLQSVCTFFAAVNGLRLAIGLGSVVLGASVGAAVDRFHSNWIRVPMVVLALAGSLLNLVVLYQVRRLRSRPASQWRQRSLSPSKVWMERSQLVLSLATLVLLGVEEYIHLLWHHHL